MAEIETNDENRLSRRRFLEFTGKSMAVAGVVRGPLGDCIQISGVNTESARVEFPEPGLSPYDLSRASGSLKFWDNPAEDIYTWDDGQPL
jgi:hypothetical protein